MRFAWLHRAAGLRAARGGGLTKTRPRRAWSDGGRAARRLTRRSGSGAGFHHELSTVSMELYQSPSAALS